MVKFKDVMKVLGNEEEPLRFLLEGSPIAILSYEQLIKSRFVPVNSRYKAKTYLKSLNPTVVSEKGTRVRVRVNTNFLFGKCLPHAYQE